ncbi:hypothetical protein ASG35_02255 [Burkholderia sp. Leaf177]|nr:hypothetical protein ASG35_02255 [Burkholderia sp. Leaf177]
MAFTFDFLEDVRQAWTRDAIRFDGGHRSGANFYSRHPPGVFSSSAYVFRSIGDRVEISGTQSTHAKTRNTNALHNRPLHRFIDTTPRLCPH